MVRVSCLRVGREQAGSMGAPRLGAVRPAITGPSIRRLFRPSGRIFALSAPKCTRSWRCGTGRPPLAARGGRRGARGSGHHLTHPCVAGSGEAKCHRRFLEVQPHLRSSEPGEPLRRQSVVSRTDGACGPLRLVFRKGHQEIRGPKGTQCLLMTQAV